MSPREHARLLGLFFYIYAGLNLLGNVVLALCVALFYFYFAGKFPPIDHAPGRGPDPNVLLGFWILVVGVAFVINLALVIVKFVGGYALRNDRPWAYPAAIAASAVSCLGVPIGTVLGVFGFMFIFGDRGKEYFRGEPEPGA